MQSLLLWLIVLRSCRATYCSPRRVKWSWLTSAWLASMGLPTDASPLLSLLGDMTTYPALALVMYYRRHCVIIVAVVMCIYAQLVPRPRVALWGFTVCRRGGHMGHGVHSGGVGVARTTLSRYWKTDRTCLTCMWCAWKWLTHVYAYGTAMVTDQGPLTPTLSSWPWYSTSLGHLLTLLPRVTKGPPLAMECLCTGRVSHCCPIISSSKIDRH